VSAISKARLQPIEKKASPIHCEFESKPELVDEGTVTTWSGSSCHNNTTKREKEKDQREKKKKEKKKKERKKRGSEKGGERKKKKKKIKLKDKIIKNQSNIAPPGGERR